MHLSSGLLLVTATCLGLIGASPHIYVLHGLEYFLPKQLQGECIRSSISGRVICYPVAEDLSSGCIGQAPPNVPHSRHRVSMRSNYDQGGRLQSYAVVQYACDDRYNIMDELHTLYCSKTGIWLPAAPKPHCVRQTSKMSLQELLLSARKERTSFA